MDYCTHARNLVVQYFNRKSEKTDDFVLTLDDTYIVWFSKTLQNWKAMVSTTVPDGMYYEITYNGDEKVTYLDAYKAAGLKNDPGVTAAGWTAAEVTVATLAQAAKSGEITRKSIIEAARNFTYEPKLGRDGVVYKMNGTEDPYLVESTQVGQFNTATQVFTDVGSLVTKFEGTTKPDE